MFRALFRTSKCRHLSLRYAEWKIDIIPFGIFSSFSLLYYPDLIPNFILLRFIFFSSGNTFPCYFALLYRNCDICVAAIVIFIFVCTLKFDILAEKKSFIFISSEIANERCNIQNRLYLKRMLRHSLFVYSFIRIYLTHDDNEREKDT